MSWNKLKKQMEGRAKSGSVDPGIFLMGKVAPQLDPFHSIIKPLIWKKKISELDEEAPEVPTEDSEEVLSAGRLAAINAKKRKGRASTIMSGGLGDTSTQGGRTILG